MTRGNTGHLHPINPEIDRTYHRLVRQIRNLPFHSVPDSVSDSDSISNSIPVSVHSVQYTDFVHFVALSDSEHSENSVYSENMAQPPTPPGPRHIWHQGHFGHYKWMICAKVKIECKGLSVGVIFGTKDIWTLQVDDVCKSEDCILSYLAPRTFGHYKWMMCAKVKIECKGLSVGVIFGTKDIWTLQVDDECKGLSVGVIFGTKDIWTLQVDDVCKSED
ncbi:hypothetical protein Lal_00043660, partial [Lupinus albus]